MIRKMNTSINHIISITELRKNFGRFTELLPRVDSLIVTRGGEPFAILKAVSMEKRKLMKKSSGAWKKTPLDNDSLWKEVFKRKSRKSDISL